MYYQKILCNIYNKKKKIEKLLKMTIKMYNQ